MAFASLVSSFFNILEPFAHCGDQKHHKEKFGQIAEFAGQGDQDIEGGFASAVQLFVNMAVEQNQVCLPVDFFKMLKICLVFEI